MEYQIIRSDRKTAAIQIKDGAVIVRAPYKMSTKLIQAFVDKHSAWISTHLAKQEKSKMEAAATPKLTAEELNKLAQDALRIIPERVKYYAPIIGVSYGKITIRNQRTRWGSCSNKGNLNFNCLLMLAPPQVLDSVVVHELCHIKELNHSAAFYKLVEKAYPDYYYWHGWLKENGQALLNRMI